jgi:hypothetical protein
MYVVALVIDKEADPKAHLVFDSDVRLYRLARGFSK